LVDGRPHTNGTPGVESSWAFAKHRLTKFKGVPRHTFYLHLKETESRFKRQRDNLYPVMPKPLRDQPI
jgi:transposase-like protein